MIILITMHLIVSNEDTNYMNSHYLRVINMQIMCVFMQMHSVWPTICRHHNNNTITPRNQLIAERQFSGRLSRHFHASTLDRIPPETSNRFYWENRTFGAERNGSQSPFFRNEWPSDEILLRNEGGAFLPRVTCSLQARKLMGENLCRNRQTRR